MRSFHQISGRHFGKSVSFRDHCAWMRPCQGIATGAPLKLSHNLINSQKQVCCSQDSISVIITNHICVGGCDWDVYKSLQSGGWYGSFEFD